MTNRVGDLLELSLWFNSEKPDEQSHAEAGIYKAFTSSEEQHGLRLGPVVFEVMDIGDDRVPEPPPEYAGKPRLLVGLAYVDKILPQLGADVGFVHDLEHDDLQRLRKVTQDAYMLSQPPGIAPLDDGALDDIINEVGPETATKSLMIETEKRSMN